MNNKEAMVMLEQLMIDNKEVLVRLKEGNPEDYTIEAIKEREECYRKIQKKKSAKTVLLGRDIIRARLQPKKKKKKKIVKNIEKVLTNTTKYVIIYM